MFERFTDRARRAVVLAQEESRVLGNDHIGVDHLVLGVVADEDGLAARVVTSFGVPLADLRDRVRTALASGTGQPASSGHIPFTPQARKALGLSLREALDLGHNDIGTEHILLGLLHEGASTGGAFLAESGMDLAAARTRVRELAEAARPREPGGRAPAAGPPAGGPRPPVPSPRCSRCGSMLADTIGTVPLDAGGHRVLVVVCGTCSTALGVLPG